MKRVLLVLVAAAMLLVAVAPQPAPGVVHEIVGQWCADRGELEPPGLLRDATFARPLVAAGLVQEVEFTGPQGPGILIDFDFDRPQMKVTPTGQILFLGTIPGVGALYIEEFVLGDRPPFTKCARLQS